MMVVKVFFFLVLMAPLASIAQAVDVKPETAWIDGAKMNGYQVDLIASSEEVKTSLSRFLKSIGKPKTSGDHLEIVEPTIAGKKAVNMLYATSKTSGQTTAAWLGTSSASEATGPDRELQRLVYDFAVTFYREKIQLQIDESLRALQAVEKQQARLINQHKELNNKIDNNGKEKIALEKALVQNKADLEDLTRKLASNGQAQDSVAVAAEQIRKVVEMHRERQRKVK
jgi:hypothetical protein